MEYLELKQMIAGLFRITEVNETDDIEFSISDDNTLRLKNSDLKQAYEDFSTINREGLLIYGDDWLETAVQVEWMPMNNKDEILEDSINGIKYLFGNPSLQYIMMLLEEISNNPVLYSKMTVDIKDSIRVLYRRGVIPRNSQDLIDVLSRHVSRFIRIKTLRIESEKSKTLVQLQDYASSYFYLYMYKKRIAIAEVKDIETALRIHEGGGISRIQEMDEPPKRKINPEILEFYTMAVEARDPFTKYISFYHVIEYHFDEVFKRKIIDEIRDKLTSPSFSYKSDKKIYELAKYAGKRMKIDDTNGKGNEFDSLKYVLSEYVNIEDLKRGLGEFSPAFETYYASQKVSFAGGKAATISWNDATGVYTTLANRIYQTRNALVHTKSEMADSQYKPQKHKSILQKEIPLIQVIAELVIQSTGKVL